MLVQQFAGAAILSHRILHADARYTIAARDEMSLYTPRARVNVRGHSRTNVRLDKYRFSHTIAKARGVLEGPHAGLKGVGDPVIDSSYILKGMAISQ